MRKKSAVAPPAKKIRTSITKVIGRIANELLIPTWGKIPSKIALATIAILIAGYSLREYTNRIGELDIDDIVKLTKHIAEIHGVKNINYNHNDILEFLLDNTRVKEDDTYITYLKRVGITTLSILIKIYTTPAFMESLVKELEDLTEILSEGAEYY